MAVAKKVNWSAKMTTAQIVSVFESAAKKVVDRPPSDRTAKVALDEGHMDAAVNMVMTLYANTDFVQD